MIYANENVHSVPLYKYLVAEEGSGNGSILLQDFSIENPGLFDRRFHFVDFRNLKWSCRSPVVVPKPPARLTTDCARETDFPPIAGKEKCTYKKSDISLLVQTACLARESDCTHCTLHLQAQSKNIP